MNGGDFLVHTLRNASGGEVRILNWGGTILSLTVPDKQGKLTDVVLGWRELESYRRNPGYLGALVGRVANRIAGGSFELDGKTCHLPINDTPRPNMLHGGGCFSHRFWKFVDRSPERLTLSLDSPDGDCGFPGDLHAEVTYSWSDDFELRITYDARCDRDTLFNPTNHAYFNLNGEASGETDDLVLTVCADEYTPADGNLIPTGIAPVGGDFPDLRRGMPLADVRKMLPDGLDHNFVLGRDKAWKRDAATVYAPRSGIIMRMSTDCRGVQIYMARWLKGEPAGKSRAYAPFAGICLETQAWPDAPHHRDFPSILLKAGAEFRSATAYRFEVER